MLYSQDEEGSPHTMGWGLGFLAAGTSESVPDTLPSRLVSTELGLLVLGCLEEEEEATVLVVEAADTELADCTVPTGTTSSSSLISPTYGHT